MTYYCFYCENIIPEADNLYVYVPHGDLVCEECHLVYGDKE